MNPFSLLILLIIVYTVLKAKGIKNKFVSLFAITIAVDMNSIAGYFMIVAGKEISYSDISLLATTVAAILYLLTQNGIRKTQFVAAMLLLTCVLIGVLHTLISIPNAKIIDYNTGWDSYLYGYVGMSNAVITSQTALMFIRLLLFLVNSFVAVRICQVGLYKVANVCKKVTCMHICYALVEAATKYVLHSNLLTEFRDMFFGLGVSTDSSLQARGTGIAIYGWTREASHLTEVMFLFVVICILTKDLRKQKIWIMLAAIIMFLSMSFSSLMYVLCIIALFLVVYQIKFNQRFLTIGFGAVVILVGFGYVVMTNDYYMSRLSGFFEDASFIISGGSTFAREAVTSSKVRLFGIVETLRAFYERPLFGLGLGTAYCNSGIVSLLSNIGLLGTLAWIYYCLHLVERNRRIKKSIIVFLTALILPNIIKGGMGMFYASYNLFIVLLIKYDFARNEEAKGRRIVVYKNGLEVSQ